MKQSENTTTTSEQQHFQRELRSLRAKTGHTLKQLRKAKADLAAAQAQEATLMVAAQAQAQKMQPLEREAAQPALSVGHSVLINHRQQIGIIYGYLPERPWPYHVVLEDAPGLIPADDGAYGVAYVAEELTLFFGPLLATLMAAYTRRTQPVLQQSQAAEEAQV